MSIACFDCLLLLFFAASFPASLLLAADTVMLIFARAFTFVSALIVNKGLLQLYVNSQSCIVAGYQYEYGLHGSCRPCAQTGVRESEDMSNNIITLICRL